jgi:secreted Zn-dependent insulinase-like peptidase
VLAPRRFISDHGGHTNAFTAAEDTNYQFDVNWDALPEALDRCVWVCAEMQRRNAAQESYCRTKQQ